MGIPDSQLVGQKYEGLKMCDWHLKSGQSCGTEHFNCGTCANPGS